MGDEHTYAERMFPGPVDLGIAQPDRAVSSVAKGDFLTIRELRGGELRFDGYHRPEWPSNARP
jgi:hypothetical protein